MTGDPNADLIGREWIAAGVRYAVTAVSAQPTYVDVDALDLATNARSRSCRPVAMVRLYLQRPDSGSPS